MQYILLPLTNEFLESQLSSFSNLALLFSTSPLFFSILPPISLSLSLSLPHLPTPTPFQAETASPAEKEAVRTRRDIIHTLVLCEVAHFHKQRREDFRDLMRAYLQAQIEFFERVSGRWKYFQLLGCSRGLSV